MTSRLTAQSLSKGEMSIEIGESIDTRFASVSRGFTEKFDVGIELEIELAPAIWGRYTFVESPGTGFAFAGTLGYFSGDFSQENELSDQLIQGDTKMRGGQLGLLASWAPPKSALGLVAEIKYTNTRYKGFEITDDAQVSSNLSSTFRTPYDDYQVSSDDLKHVVQTSLLFTWRLNNQFSLHAGPVCANAVSNENENIRSQDCKVMLGALLGSN